MSVYDVLLHEVITEARLLNIPVSNNIDPKVTVNSRAKGRFGQCKKREDKFLIEISSSLELAEVHKIKQTLAHEILHTAPECFDHQALWKRYAAKMNRTYGYAISTTNSCAKMGIEEEVGGKYTITCQTCNHKNYRDRVSNVIKHPEKYHCSCGGRLTVE
ncbi:MAG TPA: SprT-like domain-containing protein [Clostridiaceae bacterium]